MVDDAKKLDDVVVVGYGTQRKISTIGAQSSVKAITELKQPVANSTFSNSTPLILVDGVECEFNNIYPEDIESFSILKDASAKAVYGVKGANAVVNITTKQGTKGKPKIRMEYLKDFRSPRRHLPGIQVDFNWKGLVSDKGERKKAFYVLQKWFKEIEKNQLKR